MSTIALPCAALPPRYVLYTKAGYESMACIKTAEQFERECTLGRVLLEAGQADPSQTKPLPTAELHA